VKQVVSHREAVADASAAALQFLKELQTQDTRGATATETCRRNRQSPRRLADFEGALHCRRRTRSEPSISLDSIFGDDTVEGADSIGEGIVALLSAGLGTASGVERLSNRFTGRKRSCVSEVASKKCVIETALVSRPRIGRSRYGAGGGGWVWGRMGWKH